MSRLKLIEDRCIFAQIIFTEDKLPLCWVICLGLPLMFKFLYHRVKLINAERFLKDLHLFHEINIGLGTSQNVVFIFIITDLE